MEVNVLNREAALELLKGYTESVSLLKHAFSVEACMNWYARHFNIPTEQQPLWAITGLLHDFDYERYPDPVSPDGHPYKGNAILKELGYPEEITTAIMGHALYTNTARETLLAKTLFAVDELSGLITAAALVRPDKSIAALETKSVLKKMKDKAFARGCNRDDIRLGAEELQLSLEQHVTNCIEALAEWERAGA
jgi:predicted hydrolase (HD superfamily)